MNEERVPEDKRAKVAADRVTRARGVELKAVAGSWPYAENHREVIAAHWDLARKSNPNFFNGTIHVMKEMVWTGDSLSARFIATEFKNFLYWRDEGYPEEAHMRDGFGSALIRSAEGHIILGKQRPGNINAGLAYLPGGFIDTRDVGAGGKIDIRASVAREVMEETGLTSAEIIPGEDFLVAEVAGHVSFAVPYRSHLPSEELARRVRRHIEAETDPELADVVVVTAKSATEGLPMPHYARVLLGADLAWTV